MPIIDILSRMDESQKHNIYRGGKNSETKKYILSDSICMKCKQEQTNLICGERVWKNDGLWGQGKKVID